MGVDDIKVDFDVNFPLSNETHRLAMLGSLETKAKTKIKKSKETKSDVTNGLDLTDVMRFLIIKLQQLNQIDFAFAFALVCLSAALKGGFWRRWTL